MNQSTSRKMAFGRYDYASFLIFLIYSAGSVAVPVSLVILARGLHFRLDNGGLSAGGALQLGRTAAMVASMLLCGVPAGRWGKRRTLGLSVVLMGLGVGFCSLAPSYSILFLSLTLAGVGEGVIEGLTTPFVQDLHPQEPGRYINFSHAFWSVGVVITVLLSGALLAAGVSWRIIIAVIALLALLPASLLLLPERAGHAFPEHPLQRHGMVVWDNARAILQTKRFWFFFAAMFMAGGGEFCLTFWSASYIQLHFHATAWTGGAGTAWFAVGMAAGRTGWGYLLHQRHLLSLILCSALAGIVFALFLPWITHLSLFFLLLFLIGIATAPFWPSIQSYSTDRLVRADTTLLFILLACAGVPGCGVATWLMGYIGNQLGGLGKAFYLVPACYTLLALLIGGERLIWGRQPSAAPNAEA